MKEKMRIAIIVAGNARSTCVFMAAEAGYKVILLKVSNNITHDEQFERILENKGILHRQYKNRSFYRQRRQCRKNFSTIRYDNKRS